MLTIGRGEVVTVRVPTHEDGAYLFWEFATDSYDLGFGVYFEWSDVKTNQVVTRVLIDPIRLNFVMRELFLASCSVQNLRCFNKLETAKNEK